jgi:hypothetical protein
VVMYKDLTEQPITEPPLSRTGLSVQDGVARSLKAINEIEAEIVSLVRRTVARNLATSGATSSARVTVIRNLITGALQAAEPFSTGIICGLKSVVKGIILGGTDVTGDFSTIATIVLESVVTGAADTGRDVALATSRARAGIREACHELGGWSGATVDMPFSEAIEKRSAPQISSFGMLPQMSSAYSG